MSFAAVTMRGTGIHAIMCVCIKAGLIPGSPFIKGLQIRDKLAAACPVNTLPATFDPLTATKFSDETLS